MDSNKLWATFWIGLFITIILISFCVLYLGLDYQRKITNIQRNYYELKFPDGSTKSQIFDLKTYLKVEDE